MMQKIWIPDSYEDILDNAQLLHSQGDFEGAVGEYRRLVERISKLKPELLQRRPSLNELLLLSGMALGSLLREMERYDEAIALFDRLSASFPAGENIWRRNKAIISIAKGKIAAGLDELRALAVAYPSADNWRLLGVQCFWLGHYDEAEENIRRAIEMDDDAEEIANSYWVLFALYRETGRSDEALAAWEEVTAFEELNGFWEPPCRMLLRAGDLARAKRCIEREENELRQGLLRGLLAQAQGEEKQAQQHWQRVHDADPDDYEDGVEAWIEAALRLGYPEDALDVLQEYSDEEEGNGPRWHLFLAVAEANYGHADHARENLESAVKLSRQISHRPRLSAADGQLFAELAGDADFKEQARSFFAQEGDELPGYNTL
jgi:tetratricopeptide (TPR) repeat protein